MRLKGGGCYHWACCFSTFPQLVDQWAQQDIAAREDAAARTLVALADAIRAYQQSFGQLPESLEQLGPAPPEGASPDHADLIGGDLAAGSRNNYQYRYQIVTPADGGAPQFELSAVPEKYGDKGKRSFCWTKRAACTQRTRMEKQRTFPIR